jgi:hypothetical protein
LPFFASLQAEPVFAAVHRDRRWWRAFGLNTAIPALLFYPTFMAVSLMPASAWLPQVVTTQVTLWALAGAGVSLLIAHISGGLPAMPQSDWPRSLLLAVATVTIGYAVLALVDRLFHTDLRFWVIAVKLPSAHQWVVAAIYAVPLTLAFLVTLRTLCSTLTVSGDKELTRYTAAMLALTGGFIVMLGVIYGILFLTGSLITDFDPLSTVIALQFVPVLAAVAVIGIFTWKRTNSHRPGAVIAGILVTLYVVAGTATQV